MKPKPIYSFDKNDVVKIEKLLFKKESGEMHPSFGLLKNTEAVILWKSGKKTILKIGENKLAISERAAEKIFASKI